jgi:hypothetical protein
MYEKPIGPQQQKKPRSYLWSNFFLIFF